MPDTSIPTVAIQLYELLSPLSPEERLNATRAALAMHGETLSSVPPHSRDILEAVSSDDYSQVRTYGRNAERWMRQNDLCYEDFDEVFDISGSEIALLAADVPGHTKKEKTAYCYLLVGVAELLRKDEPLFSDDEAVEFCKYVGAYDANNHTANRRALANRIVGDRKHGFKLTSPGLRDAASVIKSIRPISNKPK